MPGWETQEWSQRDDGEDGLTTVGKWEYGWELRYEADVVPGKHAWLPRWEWQLSSLEMPHPGALCLDSVTPLNPTTFRFSLSNSRLRNTG